VNLESTTGSAGALTLDVDGGPLGKIATSQAEIAQAVVSCDELIVLENGGECVWVYDALGRLENRFSAQNDSHRETLDFWTRIGASNGGSIVVETAFAPTEASSLSRYAAFGPSPDGPPAFVQAATESGAMWFPLHCTQRSLLFRGGSYSVVDEVEGVTSSGSLSSYFDGDVPIIAAADGREDGSFVCPDGRWQPERPSRCGSGTELA
jgi:hypothetical protein